MPPLHDHNVRFKTPDSARRQKQVERVRGMDPIFCIIDLKALVTVILLLLFKQKFGVLHLVRDHENLMLLPQCTA